MDTLLRSIPSTSTLSPPQAERSGFERQGSAERSIQDSPALGRICGSHYGAREENVACTNGYIRIWEQQPAFEKLILMVYIGQISLKIPALTDICLIFASSRWKIEPEGNRISLLRRRRAALHMRHCCLVQIKGRRCQPSGLPDSPKC